jgi:hypothetical protein
VHCIRAQEVESGERTRPKRPRAIILEPTRELAQQARAVRMPCVTAAVLCGRRAERACAASASAVRAQVLGVSKSLCHHARFSSALISGGGEKCVPPSIQCRCAKPRGVA